MLAWREVTDGVRAYAARFDQEYAAHTGGAPLSKRLVFGEHSGTIADEGSTVRVLLEWQRLVRGGRVRRRKKMSVSGRAATQEHRQLTLQLWPTCTVPSSTAPKEEVLMRDEAHIGGEGAATSGAAAVLARRTANPRHPCGQATSPPRKRPRHTDPATRTHEPQATSPTHAADGGRDSGGAGQPIAATPSTPEGRNRNGDAQLRFSPGTLATLRRHTDLWEWTALPKGDG